MIPKCSRCGDRADFNFKESDTDKGKDYCHECYAIDHGDKDDSIEIKNMALSLLAEHQEKKKGH